MEVKEEEKIEDSFPDLLEDNKDLVEGLQKCDTCLKSLSSYHILSQHKNECIQVKDDLSLIHKIVENQSPKEEISEVEEEEKIEDSFPDLLDDNKGLVEDLHKCNTCLKSFTSYRILRQHITEVEEEDDID